MKQVWSNFSNLKFADGPYVFDKLHYYFESFVHGNSSSPYLQSEQRLLVFKNECVAEIFSVPSSCNHKSLMKGFWGFLAFDGIYVKMHTRNNVLLSLAVAPYQD